MNKTSTSKPPDESALAGLRYLGKSSQLLLATSPAISAYLGSQSNRLSSDLDIISKDKRKDKICHGCGSTMIPGWSCKKSRRNVPKARKTGVKKHTAAVSKRPSESKPTKPDHIAYDCDRCHTTSRFNLPEKKPLPATGETKALESAKASKDKPIALSPTTSAAPPLQSAPSQPSSAKVATKSESEVSGRKRAKKNKSGGLAALLAKSKSESASPAAFDLMDFMKTA